VRRERALWAPLCQIGMLAQLADVTAEHRGWDYTTE
jgi:hypothetical protein